MFSIVYTSPVDIILKVAVKQQIESIMIVFLDALK